MDITSAKDVVFWVCFVCQEDCGATMGTIFMKHDGRDRPIKGQIKFWSESDSYMNYFFHIH